MTRQLALLFFVPVVVAFIHSGFAFMALQSYFTLSIAINNLSKEGIILRKKGSLYIKDIERLKERADGNIYE